MGNCCDNNQHLNNDEAQVIVGFPGDDQSIAFKDEKHNDQPSILDQSEEGFAHRVENLKVKDQMVFTGDIKESKANGTGVLKTDLFEYEGEFVNGRPSGKGKITFANGSWYEGDFVNGFCHGKGRFSQSDGFVYSGDFQMNRFHGTGTGKWANGSSYKGEFGKGKFHGEGFGGYSNKVLSVTLTRKNLAFLPLLRMRG